MPPTLAEETKWYHEHAALLFSTLKWAGLGALAGACAGLATRAFLWALFTADAATARLPHYYLLLPLALPLCVWLIRTFAPTAKGHGTEAVITAIHERYGRVSLPVAPVKLLATILTLAAGGSVGKEGPCAQIGAAIASAFADVMRLNDEDRRRLVICGVGAGFAAVFGTPISGALFGVEVLYLGRIEYPVLFPCLIAGIIAHIICGTPPPIPHLPAEVFHYSSYVLVLLSLAAGAWFGLVALLLIETMRGVERIIHPWAARRPYWVAVGGGVFLAASAPADARALRADWAGRPWTRPWRGCPCRCWRGCSRSWRRRPRWRRAAAAASSRRCSSSARLRGRPSRTSSTCRRGPSPPSGSWPWWRRRPTRPSRRR